MSESKPVGRRAQEHQREQTILRAAIEELAQSDYGGMTIEAVAARAGVNKTTVYRKWETKADLLRDALRSVAEEFTMGETAGNLRTDLLRIARMILDFTNSSEGQSLMRLRLLQHPEPELAKIAKELNAKHLNQLSAMINAAAARGELRPDADVLLLLDMLWGAVHARVVMKNEVVDDTLLTRMVDIVMSVIGTPPKDKQPVRPRPARPRSKR